MLCHPTPAAFRSTSPQFAKWSPIWVHDGLSSGSGIGAQKKVPLAYRPWFCASATGEWISFAIFANAPLNGYTLPTNPMTKLTELLQRLQASFVPPQARFHVFPWPRAKATIVACSHQNSSIVIGAVCTFLVSCRKRPVSKIRELFFKISTRRRN